MSSMFREDAAPPDQLVVPELSFPRHPDDPDGHLRLALVEPDTLAVSALVAPRAAGKIGDALATAIPAMIAEGYGWTARATRDVALPVTIEGVEGATVRVDEAPDDRAALWVTAGGVDLGTHLCSSSALGAVGPLWGADPLEHARTE